MSSGSLVLISILRASASTTKRDSISLKESTRCSDEVASIATCINPAVSDDPAFRDSLSQGCADYKAFESKNGYSTCSAEVKAACPIACNEVNLCAYPTPAAQWFDRSFKVAPPALCAVDA